MSAPCAACVHFPRCAWLVGALPSWTECDWIPSRFVSVQPGATPASATVKGRPESPAKSDVAADSSPKGASNA
jgi:hypothetical protein